MAIAWHVTLNQDMSISVIVEQPFDMYIEHSYMPCSFLIVHDDERKKDLFIEN